MTKTMPPEMRVAAPVAVRTEPLVGYLFAPSDGDFHGQYLDAPVLETLVAQLSALYPELRFLERYRVRVIWKRHGGDKLGRCKRVSGELAHFLAADWLIWLGADNCRIHELTPLQIEALLYHELLHCAEEDEEPVLVKHDLEFFYREVERYGRWLPNREKASEVFEQLALALDAAEDEDDSWAMTAVDGRPIDG